MELDAGLPLNLLERIASPRTVRRHVHDRCHQFLSRSAWLAPAGRAGVRGLSKGWKM